MFQNTCFISKVCCITTLAFTASSVPLPAISAIVTNDEISHTITAQNQRDRLTQFMDRKEVRQALIDHGVAPENAVERVASLTDEEVSQLNQKIDELPAGEGVLEAALVVVLILVLLEILGFTDYSSKL